MPDRASPSLDTVHAVADAVRGATKAGKGPLSLQEIGRLVPDASAQEVRRSVDELDRLGFVAEGRHGILWTNSTGEMMKGTRT